MKKKDPVKTKIIKTMKKNKDKQLLIFVNGLYMPIGDIKVIENAMVLTIRKDFNS